MAANGKEAEKQTDPVQQITDFFNAKDLGLIEEENGQFYLGYQAVGGTSILHVFYDFDEITIEENGDYVAYNLKDFVEKELSDKKTLKSYYPPRIIQFGTLLKDEIYSILSRYRFALPGSIDGERVRQHKIVIASGDTDLLCFKFPDEFTEMALIIAELESVDDIFDYINEELEKDQKTARLTQALYEIKIAVFHKIIDNEGRCYKLIEFLKDINRKIEETKGQEIQSKWQELKDHLYSRIEFIEPSQYKNILKNIKTSPASFSSGSEAEVNQEAEYLLLLKRDIYKTLTTYNENQTKEFQDGLAKVALKISEPNSAKEICAYLSGEIRECRHNASLSFFAGALSDIKILAFHQMVEHEFSYNEIKSELEYVGDKIEETKEQEIQSKWKALREHMITKMKAMEEEQAEKTAPQNISEYSSGYFASSGKSSIPSAGQEIISSLKRKFLFGNR